MNFTLTPVEFEEIDITSHMNLLFSDSSTPLLHFKPTFQHLGSPSFNLNSSPEFRHQMHPTPNIISCSRKLSSAASDILKAQGPSIAIQNSCTSMLNNPSSPPKISEIIEFPEFIENEDKFCQVASDQRFLKKDVFSDYLSNS